MTGAGVALPNPLLREGRGQTRFLRCSYQPSIGRGLGKPGFPMSQPLVGAAGAPHRQRDGEPRFPRMVTSGRGLGKLGFPSPNRWWERLAPPTGRGAVRQAHRRWGTPGSPYGHLREGVGETRFPHVPTAGGSGWRPHGQGDGETRFPHPLTAVGDAWHPGEQERREPPVPHVRVRPHARGAQRQNKNICSWEGYALPNPPAREGDGEPRFPHFPWERLAPPQAGVRFDRLTAGGEPRFPRMVTSGRGLGKPGFPDVHISGRAIMHRLCGA